MNNKTTSGGVKILSNLNKNNILSNIKSFINIKNFMIVLFIIILIFISIYYYNNYIKSKIKPKFKENSEFLNKTSNNEAEIILFFVDWCPHCKTSKPEWDLFKEENNGKFINGYKLIVSDRNCTEETPEIQNLINTYNIEGYPTIKLIKNGEVIDYDAKPNKETLEQFVRTLL